MKYRRKQKIIEAEQYQHFSQIEGVVEEHEVVNNGTNEPFTRVKRAYLQEVSHQEEVTPGDWIITGDDQTVLDDQTFREQFELNEEHGSTNQ